MKNLVIIGSGGHTRSVISATNLIGKWNIIGIVDIDFNGNEEYINNIRVTNLEKLLSQIIPSETDAVISVGDNLKRLDVFDKVKDVGLTFPNIIHPRSFVDDSAKIGFGNYVGQFANIGAYSQIGNFNLINTYANVEHEVAIGDFNQLAPSSTICGRSSIESGVFLGANSVVIDKLVIASNTKIGAGSVVIKNIHENGKTYIGVPAKLK